MLLVIPVFLLLYASCRILGFLIYAWYFWLCCLFVLVFTVFPYFMWSVYLFLSFSLQYRFILSTNSLYANWSYTDFNGFFSRFTVFGLYSCCQGSHLAFSFNSIDGLLFCIFGFVFLLNEFRYCLFMSCCRHLSFGFLSYWASLLSIFTFTLASPIVMISAFLCNSLEWRSSYERFLSPSLGWFVVFLLFPSLFICIFWCIPCFQFELFWFWTLVVSLHNTSLKTIADGGDILLLYIPWYNNTKKYLLYLAALYWVHNLLFV